MSQVRKVTDPNVLNALGQGAPAQEQQPIPQPSVPQMPISIPRKTQNDRTEQAIGLDRESNDRDWIRIRLAEEAAERERREKERKERERAATGGVEPTESEATAGFLTTQLTSHINRIKEIQKDVPDAMQPGWTETIAGTFGDRAKALVLPEKVKSAREILNNRYRMATDVLLTLGTGAAYTQEQRDAYIEAYSPQVTDSPETVADKGRMMAEALEAARVKSGVAKVNVDLAMENLAQLYGGPITGEAAPVRKELATGDKESLEYPKDIQDRYTARMNSIKPGTLTVEKYLEIRREVDNQAREAFGFQPDPNLTLDNVKEFVDAYNKNPASVSLKLQPMEKSLTPLEGAISSVAGSPVGTGLMNAANAGALGIPRAMMDEAEQEKFALASASNPNAAAVGDILGSIAPSMAGENLLALGIKGGFKRGLATDIGTNAIRGYMDDGAEGAVQNSLLGAAGNIGGTLAFKGARGFMPKSKVDDLDRVANKDLTLFQASGLGKIEETWQGVPVVRGQRAQAVETWNKDNVDKVLAPLGEKLGKEVPAGVEANDAMNKILNNRYNTIRPKIVGTFDGKFRNAAVALKTQGTASPLKKQLYEEIAAIEQTFKNGQYDGNSFKDADQRLRALADDWLSASAETVDRPSVYHEMGRLAEQFRKQLRAQVGRNTPEIAEELRRLDRAWAEARRIENATVRALQSNEGIYSPGQLIQSIKTLDTSKGKGASARGKALGQEDAMAAQRVMGSKTVPETPSWLQSLAAVGAGTGATLGGPLVALPLTTVAVGAYTPLLNRITKTLIAGKRPSQLDLELLNIPLSRMGSMATSQALREYGDGEE